MGARTWTCVAALAAALALVSAAAAAAPPKPPPLVTIIGDSVPTALQYDQTAKQILSQGADVDLELAVCRRVEQPSCFYQGVQPPSVVDLVPTLGPRLGPIAVVDCGYNDWPQIYPKSVADAVSALRDAGVRQVLWVTLREASTQYAAMNDAIRAFAADNPDVTVVDWDAASQDQPQWFQPDGLHLNWMGARALAQLLHAQLVKLGAVQEPPVPRVPAKAKAKPKPSSRRR